MACGMTYGNPFKIYYQEVLGLWEGQQRTTASLWKQFYIDIEPEFLGQTYHKDLGTSPWSLPVLVVGAALGS